MGLKAQIQLPFTDSVCAMIERGERTKPERESVWELKLIAPNRYRVDVEREGALFQSIEILKSEDGNCYMDGKNTLYRSDGTKIWITEYLMGYVHGRETCFYPNEDTYKIYNYEKGVLSGPYLEYYKNGNIKENGKYLDGAKVGKWITRHPNLTPSSEGVYYPEYVKAVLDDSGDTIIFKDNLGKELLRKSTFPGLDTLMLILETEEITDITLPLKLFSKDGEWLYYDEKGNVIRKEFYRKGELIRTDD